MGRPDGTNALRRPREVDASRQQRRNDALHFGLLMDSEIRVLNIFWVYPRIFSVGRECCVLPFSAREIKSMLYKQP